jgi:two-component SAPR family response regulator
MKTLGFGAGYGSFMNLTITEMKALLKKYQGNYKWVKKDYVDWIVNSRETFGLSAFRVVWEAKTIKELKAEKARIEAVELELKKVA